MAATFTLTLVDKVTGAGRAVRGTVDDVQAGLVGLADTAAKVDSTPIDLDRNMKAGGAAAAMDVLSGRAREMVGNVVPAEGAVGALGEALGALGPKGRAVAVALALVVTAATAAVVVLYRLALAALAVVEAKDGMLVTFAALGDGATAGAATLEMVERLARELPFVTTKIGEWAKSLMTAGITGASLERGVRAIAAATALMGDSGGAAADTLIKRFAQAAEVGEKVKLDRRLLNQFADAGVSAGALARALGVPVDKLTSMEFAAGKVGDALQKALIDGGAGAIDDMGADVDTLKAKLSEGWDSLFEGLGDAVGPFMNALRDLFAEFYKGSTNMKAGQSAMTSMLGALFEAGTGALRGIHKGFLTVEIAALKVATAVAPVVKVIQKLGGSETMVRGLSIAMGLLAVPFIGLATLVAAGVALFGSLFAVLGMLAGYIGVVISAVIGLVGAIGGMIKGAATALAGWAASALEAAAAFVSGLVNGITTGAGRVAAAVKGLASSAVSALMGALQARSPSRLTMGIGDDVFAAGMEMGVDDGAGRVGRAAGRLGAEAAAEIQTGAGGAPGAAAVARGAVAGGAMAVTFAPGSIVIDGAGKSAMEISEEMIARVFERLAASQGLLVPT